MKKTQCNMMACSNRSNFVMRHPKSPSRKWYKWCEKCASKFNYNHYSEIHSIDDINNGLVTGKDGGDE